MKRKKIFKDFIKQTKIDEWIPIQNDPSHHYHIDKTYPRLIQIELPQPELPSKPTFKDLLDRRESAKEFSAEIFSLQEVSNLLGTLGYRVNPDDPIEGRKKYPSAGAKYPIETYIISLKSDEIEKGLYHYAAKTHSLETLVEGDFTYFLCENLNDERIERASLIIIFTVIYQRLAAKYGNRSLRYSLIEVGHMAQNISLGAELMNKACYDVGGFLDDEINDLLDIEQETEASVMLMALGGKVDSSKL